jgi:PAS domain S-box-containing protein
MMNAVLTRPTQKPLNALLVEDSRDDADLLAYELRNAGFNLNLVRVETEPDFLAELSKKPDIILSDYSMPRFSGLRAMELARESGLDIPFILISGTVGEDVAVDAMRGGATDYLLKDRLSRLGQAVERALAEAKERTKLKEAERKFHATDAQLRQLLEHSPAVIYSLRMDGPNPVPQIVSDNILALLGFTVEETLSYEWWLGQLHPEDRARAMANITETLRDDVSQIEYRIRHKNGTYRWIEDKQRVIHDSPKQPGYIVGIWIDVTERRRLEAQFLQAQKMESFGQLAGGVAHDFNNILSIIQMQSVLLKSIGGLSAEQSECADEIVGTVQRASALTRQLLLFSRREVFQPRDLNLNDSVCNTMKMLQRILGETIQTELKLALEPMFVHADAGMIDQIIMNLTVNARDAMPGGGRLIIETTAADFDELTATQSLHARAGSFVCLSVSDTGTGISPEILHKIFEPFFTTKDVGKGTGLGLATVFGIVQQHRGWINVYSEVGHGTTFRVYLPRLASQTDQGQTRRALKDLRGGQETILLVEDDFSLRTTIHKTLSKLGYQILEAGSAAAAIEIWKEKRDQINLLLTDMVMPGNMSGKELAQALRQENQKLRVIYMSGYSTELAGKDFPLKEGVNFLIKPFQAEKLALTIRARLDE